MPNRFYDLDTELQHKILLYNSGVSRLKIKKDYNGAMYVYDEPSWYNNGYCIPDSFLPKLQPYSNKQYITDITYFNWGIMSKMVVLMNYQDSSDVEDSDEE